MDSLTKDTGKLYFSCRHFLFTLGSKSATLTHQMLLQLEPWKNPYHPPRFFEESLTLIEKTPHMRSRTE
jgi:hypothetical protein